jgi:hypothetical protein
VPRPADLLAATAVMALACLAFQRANALAEAVAPTAARGRYLAAVLVRWLSGRLPAAALRAEEPPAPRSDHAQAEQQAVGGHRG